MNIIKNNISLNILSFLQNQIKTTPLVQILFGFISISLLSACDSNSNKESVSRSVVKIPNALELLAEGAP